MVELGKVIGIGGEGIVLEEELEIEVMKGTAKDMWCKKAENILLKSKETSVAMKFVKLEPDILPLDYQGKGSKTNCSEKNYFQVETFSSF